MINTPGDYWQDSAIWKWNRHVRKYRTEERVELPYTKDARYLSRPHQDYGTFLEAVGCRLIGKGRIEFSDLTPQPHQAFFLAKAAYAFEVHDITDHWFGDDA